MIEFGASWCGHCQLARPLVDQVLAEQPDVRHLWVEDGPGQPLGRSFRVKLWPTLVFYNDGVEVARLVRPRSVEPIREAMAKLVAASSGMPAAR